MPSAVQAERTDVLLLAVFTAIESGHFFSAALPSVFTIDKFSQGDPRAKEKLTEGMAYAWMLSIGMASVVSLLAHSWLPLLITVAVALLMTVMYSQAMKGAPANA